MKLKFSKLLHFNGGLFLVESAKLNKMPAVVDCSCVSSGTDAGHRDVSGNLEQEVNHY